MNYERPTRRAWATAWPQLRGNPDSRAELVGPCPLCGGRDRFRISRDARAYCRQCLPNGQDAGRLRELLRRVGFESKPDRTGARRDRPRQRPVCPDPPPTSPADLRKLAARKRGARRLWDAAAGPVEPVLAYLSGRLGQPVEALPDGARSILPAAARGAVWMNGPPPGTVAVLAWKYSKPGENAASAVAIEALDADGRRLPEPGKTKAWKRTIGVQRATIFRVTEPRAEGADRLAIAEGPLDALAVVHLAGRAECWSAGSANLAPLAEALAEAAARGSRPVEIWSDKDSNGTGQRAALALWGALGALRTPARIVPAVGGADPAESLAAAAAEDRRGADDADAD